MADDVTAAPSVGIGGRTLLLVGAVSAIVGSLLAIVANVLRPNTASAHIDQVVYLITQSDGWGAVHLTLILGLILILAALAAIALTIDSELGATVARFALLASLLGGVLILVSAAIDGFAVNQLARSWQLAPVEERATALRITAAAIALSSAINSLAWVTLLGIGTFLYGLAIILSSAYPKPLGWLAMLSGAGAFAVGVAQGLGGPALDTAIFSGLFAALIMGWVLIMGVLMLRKAGAPERKLVARPAAGL